MSGATQVDLDWGGLADAAATPDAPVGAAGANGSATATYLTDEEILGIDPPSSDGDFGGRARLGEPSDSGARGRQRDSGDLGTQGRQGKSGDLGARARRGETGKLDADGLPREASENVGDNAQRVVPALTEMPAWMQAAAGDPAHGAEAQRLWREHQEFRAAFASPDEARAIKELFPGGAQEAHTLKQASQSVERIDAAIFSGDVRAQSEVVAELARANPAAFRSLFAAAARVLGVGQSLFGGGDAAQNGTRFRDDLNGPTLRQEREGWGTRQGEPGQTNSSDRRASTDTGRGLSRDTLDGSQNGTRFRDDGIGPTLRQDREGWGTRQGEPGQTNSSDRRASTDTGRGLSRDTLDGSQNGTRFRDDGIGPTLRQDREGWGTRQNNFADRDADGRQSAATSQASAAFDPAAYASFERSTNDVVARDVRTTIGDTLARVLPEGVADGAARRIGDDIFNEVHRALAEDRALAEQVGATLRGPVAGQGWRFGSAEQQRVAAMLAGRARQLVPSVARRVIGEWTSSVLGTARSKAARQAAAASRVDISATGGSLDSTPLRAMSRREVNYASMSDDEILGM